MFVALLPLVTSSASAFWISPENIWISLEDLPSQLSLLTSTFREIRFLVAVLSSLCVWALQRASFGAGQVNCGNDHAKPGCGLSQLNPPDPACLGSHFVRVVQVVVDRLLDFLLALLLCQENGGLSLLDPLAGIFFPAGAPGGLHSKSFRISEDLYCTPKT